MTPEEFVKIGFNVNEAKVYVALLKYGRADVKTLVKELGFHKNIVYDNLNKLLDKAIISYIVEDNRKVFFVESPDSLNEFIERKQKELDDEKKVVQHLVEDIKTVKTKTLEIEDATILRGKKAVKKVMDEIYNTVTHYRCFGAPIESSLIMGDSFWARYHLIHEERNIKSQIIMNSSMKKKAEQMEKFPHQDVRFMESGVEPLTETMITDDRVSLIVWVDNPIVIDIKNKQVIESYQKFFDLLWEQSKE